MVVTVGDFVGIDKATASRAIHRVSRAIASISQQFIRMPVTQEEIQEVKTGFHNIARFPKVLGAIDCTHIRIQSPGKGWSYLF